MTREDEREPSVRPGGRGNVERGPFERDTAERGTAERDPQRHEGEQIQSALAVGQSLRRHWVLVAALVIVGSALGVLAFKLQPKVFRATAMIEFDLRSIRPLADKTQAMRGDEGGDSRDYYDAQIRIITSERVLSSVARDLGLQRDASFLDRRTVPNPLPTIEEVTDILRKEVIVEPIKNGRLVLLHCEDTNSGRAKVICESVASTFIAQNLEKTVSATADAVNWLNGQVNHYRTELEGSENAVHDFKQKNDLPSTSINDSSNMIRVEMQQFDEAVSHVKTRLSEAEARYSELSAVDENNPDALPASELLSSAYLQGLRGQYQTAVRERQSLLAEGKAENHPLVQSARARVDTARDALLAEVRNIKSSVGHDVSALRRTEHKDAALFDAARRRAVELNMKEIEFHRLDRSRDENEKLYALLLERMKEADLARRMNVNEVHLVDAPTDPQHPVRPRFIVDLALGLFVGLVLGIASALLVDQLDTTLKLPEDLEIKVGVPCLGLVPERESSKRTKREKSRRNTDDEKPELLVHFDPRGATAEAARSIRTNILFRNPDRPPRVILVSSAAPSEGKTTNACNIAIALAQSGLRVCIVDCDLRKPRLHRVFDRQGDMGVTNYMLGDATLDQIAKPTIIENLWSIPAGPIPPNPADLLHSERFKKFIRELGASFDRVIVDSPPLAAVTDSAVLSRLVDGSIFVVRAFKTPVSLARQGLRALSDVDAPIIGAVLNAVDLTHGDYKYQHYYYYRREGYGETLPRPADEERPAIN